MSKIISDEHRQLFSELTKTVGVGSVYALAKHAYESEIHAELRQMIPSGVKVSIEMEPEYHPHRPYLYIGGHDGTQSILCGNIPCDVETVMEFVGGHDEELARMLQVPVSELKGRLETIVDRLAAARDLCSNCTYLNSIFESEPQPGMG